MNRLNITQVETSQHITDVQAILREYLEWSGGLGEDNLKAPTFHDANRELETLPGIYVPPTSRLLIAYWDGEPAGCVALKPVDETTAELKRLYVKPEYRGLKIGAVLVDRIMDEARISGYERMILDTHIKMTAAHAIYEARGFYRVPAPADFPESFKPVVVFMECDL